MQSVKILSDFCRHSCVNAPLKNYKKLISLCFCCGVFSLSVKYKVYTVADPGLSRWPKFCRKKLDRAGKWGRVPGMSPLGPVNDTHYTIVAGLSSRRGVEDNTDITSNFESISNFKSETAGSSLTEEVD